MQDHHAPRRLRRVLTGIFIGCLLMLLLTTTAVVLRATTTPHIFTNPLHGQSDGPGFAPPTIARPSGLVTVDFLPILLDVVWAMGAAGSLLWLISSNRTKSQAAAATTVSSAQ